MVLRKECYSRVILCILLGNDIYLKFGYYFFGQDFQDLLPELKAGNNLKKFIVYYIKPGSCRLL